jgi:CHAT domain-containing protein/tetratricopeptide (TPR) repeat protein
MRKQLAWYLWVGFLAVWHATTVCFASPPSTVVLQDIASQHQQVVQLYRHGHYREALALALQVCDLARQQLGEEHPEVATALDNLGVLYKTLGNYTAAEPLLLQALAIRASSLGADNPDFVTSLNNLAGLYRAIGRYRAAEQLYQRALAIVRTAVGEDNEMFAGALHNLASLYKVMGHYAAALPLYQRLLAFWRQHADAAPVALTLNNLAELAFRLGYYPAAENLYRQALDLTEAHFGQAHPQFAKSLNNLAALYEAMGQYDKAEPLYQQALTVLRGVFPEPHPTVAAALNNLAGLYKTLGDYTQAETLYRQASGIWRATVGEAHADFAASLLNLADLFYTQGQFAAATPLYQQALAIQQQTLGAPHLEVATTLNSLAVLARAQGQYAAAEAHYHQALSIRRTVLGEAHPEAALLLHNLGALYQAMGHYPAAEAHYQQALVIRRTLLGAQHPDVAASLYNLAALYAATARPGDALARLQQAAGLEERVLGQVFAMSSERQRMAYLQTIRENLDAIVSFVFQYADSLPGVRQAGLELILRRKALGAEALAVQREAILGGKYPALQPLLQEWLALRQQIARKRLEGPGPEGAQAHQQTLAEWEAGQEQREAELVRQIPEMQLHQRLRQVDLPTVARALPAATALVEFVRVRLYDFQALPARGEAVWRPARYLAFIILAGEPATVRMVDLGEATPIERLIASWRAALLGGDRQLRIATLPAAARADDGAALRAVVFDPLLPALQGRTRLFLAPDGDLTTIPFEVLPSGDGQYVIDTYELSYLSTGRDVLRFTHVPSATPGPALVMADPDFNLQQPSTTAEQPLAPAQIHFTPLPGTRLEGTRIAAMLGVQPWMADAALESRLKGIRSPRIVHIATHGFFLAAPPTGSDRAGPQRLLAQRLDNPLWRSGLALAGANAWLAGAELPAAAEDGILTAEDVTAMDLLGTELVVLSACETGLGDVQVGEGVFGLRRAFVLSGARTLVMSLWKVPDQPTQELMEDFYRRLLAGTPRAAALREAQLALKSKYPAPLNWGAFICQGDPRQMP